MSSPQYDPYQHTQQDPGAGTPYPGASPYPPPPGYQPPGYQPAPGYQPFPAPGYPAYAPVQQTNTMAILAIIFPWVFAPLAIVFGHIARKQIRERNESGDGLALAGLICGYIFTSIYVLVCGAYIFVIANVLSSANYS